MKRSARFGIVSSQFNQALCQRLVQGAEKFLDSMEVNSEQIIKLEVPGAFELPLGAKYLAALKSNPPLGLIALGVIIRGETPHFEYIASESARGIMQVGLEYSIPIGYGVITADTYEQAAQRADPQIFKGEVNKQQTTAARTNNGYQAAAAMWQMAQAKSKLQA